jgi:hypothetical protein
MGRLDIRLAFWTLEWVFRGNVGIHRAHKAAAPGRAAALGAASFTTTGVLLNPFDGLSTNNLLSLATGEEVWVQRLLFRVG